MITQLKKGALELCALCCLKEGDMYGYELAQAISKEVEVSEGTIYPLLKRIRDDSFVRTYIRESNEGPPRRYYSLTPEGETHRCELLKQWQSFTEAVNRLIEGGHNA